MKKTGMICEIKNILQEALSERCPGVPVVRSAAEESHAVMSRKFPLVSLITNPGRFDDREAKNFRYYDEASNSYKNRYVRGERSVPVLLRCWGSGEDETDVLFSRILPAIPRKFQYDGFDGLILIQGEEHSDHADTLSKVYVSVAEILFVVSVALEEEDIPTITDAEVDTGAGRL
jgi:hypothetical protein